LPKRPAAFAFEVGLGSVRRYLHPRRRESPRSIEIVINAHLEQRRRTIAGPLRWLGFSLGRRDATTGIHTGIVGSPVWPLAARAAADGRAGIGPLPARLVLLRPEGPLSPNRELLMALTAVQRRLSYFCDHGRRNAPAPNKQEK
jgi:hypothetical protein